MPSLNQNFYRFLHSFTLILVQVFDTWHDIYHAYLCLDTGCLIQSGCLSPVCRRYLLSAIHPNCVTYYLKRLWISSVISLPFETQKYLCKLQVREKTRFCPASLQWPWPEDSHTWSSLRCTKQLPWAHPQLSALCWGGAPPVYRGRASCRQFPAFTSSYGFAFI